MLSLGKDREPSHPGWRERLIHIDSIGLDSAAGVLRFARPRAYLIAPSPWVSTKWSLLVTVMVTVFEASSASAESTYQV